MTTVTVAGQEVHVIDRGSGEPVVFLHAYPFNAAMWEYQYAALEGTHRVIGIDLPGFGSSPAMADPKAATMGNQTKQPDPAGLNYDLWVGPAAWEEYQPNRCHYNFRWYFNYAGGMTGVWGVHMIDVVLLGMSKDNNLVMPTRVASTIRARCSGSTNPSSMDCSMRRSKAS